MKFLHQKIIIQTATATKDRKVKLNEPLRVGEIKNTTSVLNFL